MNFLGTATGKGLTSVVILVSIALTAQPTAAQQQPATFVRPIEGSRMVIGKGEVPDYTIDCFLYLCGKDAPNIAIIDLDGIPRVDEARWKQRGAKSVQVLSAIPENREALTLQLLDVDGVWIEGDVRADDSRRVVAIAANQHDQTGWRDRRRCFIGFAADAP